LVNLARAEGELDALLGTSLAVDAVATADEIIVVSPVPGAFLEFLDRLGTAIRLYFEAARNIADLAHLYNVTSLVLTAVTLWYVMQAATSEDIDKLRTTVEQQRETVNRQTDAMRQEFKTSRQQFAEKLEELTKRSNSLLQARLQRLHPLLSTELTELFP
jgi:DNA anti-recombination protein RmuC